VIIDTESLDSAVHEEMRKQMIEGAFGQPEIPNPFEGSEFDLKSVMNHDKEAKQLVVPKTNRYNKLFNELKKQQGSTQKPAKIVMDTGSLKTSTM
jgi:hypothetical protein